LICSWLLDWRIWSWSWRTLDLGVDQKANYIPELFPWKP